MEELKILNEISGFLNGYNNDLKYLVNVETESTTNYADCIIHEPNTPHKIVQVKYTPFLYMKDLSKFGHVLYRKNPEILEHKKIQFGITITELKTGNHDRLKDGFCYKISSSKSFESIISFLRDGGIYPYEKHKNN